MATLKTTHRTVSIFALIVALVAGFALFSGADEAYAAWKSTTKNAGNAQTVQAAQDAQGAQAVHADQNGKNGKEIWLERAKQSVFARGKASWYGGRFHTAQTASGVPYDMYTFTAAHRTLPFGTIVRVTDQYNGKSVMVCVTDRGPYVKGRIIDMSYVAADRIGLKDKGVSTVNLEVVGDPSGKPLNASQAFFVDVPGANGQDRFGPYETFADATALQQALLVAHPDASVVLDDRGQKVPGDLGGARGPEVAADGDRPEQAR